MEYVYAALLLSEAGKPIDEKGLMEVVKAAGFTPDEARAKAVVASLKDVNIKDVIKNAQTQAAAAPTAAPQHAEGEKKEQKKEEKKDEKKEEAAAEGLASLFG
jgi:large subunit ribosomal protein L12